MWCCGEQNQIPAMCSQEFGQLVVLRLRKFAATLVSRKVMGFVEHDEIPRRGFFQPLHSRSNFKRVHAGDQAVMLGKGIRLPVEDISFASKDLEIKIEDFIEFPMPIIDQTCWDNH